MKAELVSVATAKSLELNRLPSLVGQDAASGTIEPRQGDCRCVISEVGDHLEVWDLGSRDGTFVNGVRVTKATLKSNDRVSFGQTEFEVHYDHGPHRYLYGVRS
jgi:hypothetical protein